MISKWLGIAGAALTAVFGAGAAAQSLTTDQAERFARFALDCVHREYPNKISHVLTQDSHALPPHQLHPAFYGCFDWHSAVHGHWLLVRLLRTQPDASYYAEATAAIDFNLTTDNILAEVAYFSLEERRELERPYGLAWVLKLATELRAWNDPRGAVWLDALAPLEAIAAERLRDWAGKLSYPVRAGTHSQSAFALVQMHGWALAVGDQDYVSFVEDRARAFYEQDRDCPIGYEPSGQDFLSPCLMEADLMRRIMDRQEFSSWLTVFLPGLPRTMDEQWLAPAALIDRSDGDLVHLDGLNLSRAWNLDGIAAALPQSDPRAAALRESARLHRQAGLAGLSGEHYASSHWLASFALYSMSQ